MQWEWVQFSERLHPSNLGTLAGIDVKFIETFYETIEVEGKKITSPKLFYEKNPQLWSNQANILALIITYSSNEYFHQVS